MGTTNAKFKGKGNVLGSRDAPPEPAAPTTAQKPRPSSISNSLPKAKKAPAARTPEEQARAQQLLVEKRTAAANAALARTQAWDNRISKFREQQEKSTPQPTLKWNESSIASPGVLPPLAPELIRKQREAAEKLAQSGFNPYQATMANSASARNAIDNMNLPSFTPPPVVDNAAIMARSRTRLLEAMRGSNVAELAAAINFAAPFDVPELDEAKEIYLVLADQQAFGELEEEEGEDFGFIQSLVDAICTSEDSVDIKRLAKTTLVTILSNLVQSPHEAKFRKIRLGNKQIQERVVKPQGCLALLEAVGFTKAEDEQGELCMLVPDPNLVPKAQVEYARRACNVAIAALEVVNFA
ncbi:hypothetical protein BASA81_001401 [Batrachochytrium salamandrivorans]|nr:hypothetical protein BASA81_001401 [Batrachochytrium salamandrivorans]